MSFQSEIKFYGKRVPVHMKILVYFCIVLLYILSACRCKSPVPKETNAAAGTIPEIAAIKGAVTQAETQDSVSISTNEGIKAIDWTIINTDFMTNCLNPFLTSKRIKSDCTDCDKIMFSFSIVVDGKGKIQAISKEKENISCIRMTETEKKELEKEILIYMKKLILPTSFYKTIYKGSLGFILKC